jgi:dienelactone hydrolase
MAIVENTVIYYDGDTELEAFYAYDNANNTPKPGILISHTWVGRNAFVENKARQLAESGFVGFALDMYGKGVLGKNNDESARLMQPLMQNRARLQNRMTLALNSIRQLPCVDSTQIAAIGFCFGGLCVLDLARTGVNIAGIVSFHGLLDAPERHSTNLIKTKILAFHGHDDPMVPPALVNAFQEEMTQAEADWQFVSYGNTMHAFTNPVANDPALGTVYQASADKRSWRAMMNFFDEIFVV